MRKAENSSIEHPRLFPGRTGEEAGRCQRTRKTLRAVCNLARRALSMTRGMMTMTNSRPSDCTSGPVSALRSVDFQ